MKPKVYIETSIPSFYHETRQNAEALVRKEWTRRWWNLERQKYQLFTSEAVYAEMSQTPEPKKQLCIELLDTLDVLPIESEIATIVDAYIFNKIMPSNGLGDALHLAIASYFQCDFLLTWNCKHLANANKFRHIERMNDVLNLFVPKLITPLELLGDNYE